MKGVLLGLLCAMQLASTAPLLAQARRFPINDDESRVTPYTLPDPLARSGGGRITTADEWRRERRPELLALFEREIYGRSPPRPEGMWFETTSLDTRAYGGRATRKQVRVHFLAGRSEPYMDVLLYVPNARRGKVPAFLALTYGNHTITADTGVAISPHFLRDNPLPDSAGGRAPRGAQASRWVIDTIIARGYALAAVYLGDLDPDSKNGVADGIRPWYMARGQRELRPDDWAALASWGWGLSRALDYLERDPDVDAKRVALVGHSRTGKASLWAGARDPRFAMIIANESGMGGAKLSRRNYGQTVIDINDAFPYWFARNFRKYDDRERELPVDQHELIALIAPRPVYVAAAMEDQWADPRGMFLAAKGAESVYRLLGARSTLPDSMPGVHQPTLDGPLGFHLRTGVHDVTEYDWTQFLAFADRHLRR
ncbi:MAG: acetylxylan esterase [bacterium]